MADTIRLTDTETGIRWMELTNPPLNLLNGELWRELRDAIAGVRISREVRGVVLCGAGANFCAGADVRWINAGGDANGHEILRELEDLPIPVVAAIRGVALGGGLELAMAAHARVVVEDAVLGLPEVLVGLMPGLEGSQRLPRLVGIENAIRMAAFGEKVSGAEGFAIGLADRMVSADMLRQEAEKLALQLSSLGQPPRRTRNIPLSFTADEERQATVTQRAQELLPGQAAPRRVIEAIFASTETGFDEACQLERRLVAMCIGSSQAKAMGELFFSERRILEEIRSCSREFPSEGVWIIGADCDVRNASAIRDKLAAKGAKVLGFGSSLPMVNAGSGVPILLVVESLSKGLSASRDRIQALEGQLDPRVPLGVVHVEQAEVTGMKAAWRNPSRVFLCSSVDGAPLPEIAELFAPEGSSLEMMTQVRACLGRSGIQTFPARCGSPGCHHKMRSDFSEFASMIMVRREVSLTAMLQALERFGFSIDKLGGVLKQGAGERGESPDAHTIALTVLSLAVAAHEATMNLTVSDWRARQAQGDIIAVRGLGFPRAWGGPLRWARRLGADRLQRFVDELGGLVLYPEQQGRSLVEELTRPQR